MSNMFQRNCYLSVLQPFLGNCPDESLTHSMGITALYYSTQRSPGALQQGWVSRPSQAPSGVSTGKLPLLI